MTGAWGKKALAEAGKYMETNVAATSKDSNFSTIPDVSEWKLTPGAKFVHICSNETIGGVEFKDVPDTGDVPSWRTCPLTTCPSPSTSRSTA